MKKVRIYSTDSILNKIIRISTLIISTVVAIILLYQFNQTKKQIDIQEKGKTSDRFRDGIELLGTPNDATTIGGIYLLDNLAREYPNEYAAQVFEVFCGYLRTDTKKNWYNHIEKYRESNIIDSLIISKYIFPDKYQTIIDKVFKDTTMFYFNFIGKNYKINLREACFVNADLSSANFSRANLEYSKMIWSKADSTKFESTNLRYAELKEMCLINTNFVRADLSGAKLQGAYMFQTHMQGSRLDATSMEGSYLFSVNLEGAHLASTHLEGSKIDYSTFDGACLYRVHFDGAIISRSSFKGVSGNYGGVDISLMKDDDEKYGYGNRIFLNGASEFCSTELILEYVTGHKLIIIKQQAGKSSNILENNSTLKFGLLNKYQIDSIKIRLIKLSISKENQDLIMGVVNLHNDEKEDIKELFIKGKGILTEERANEIIKRVDKELGNY